MLLEIQVESIVKVHERAYAMRGGCTCNGPACCLSRQRVSRFEDCHLCSKALVEVGNVQQAAYEELCEVASLDSAAHRSADGGDVRSEDFE